MTDTRKNLGTEHLGPFDHEHRSPPPPFNPLFDPDAEDRYRRVTQSMQDDGFYDNHTREECKVEWGRRYDRLKDRGATQ